KYELGVATQGRNALVPGKSWSRPSACVPSFAPVAIRCLVRAPVAGPPFAFFCPGRKTGAHIGSEESHEPVSLAAKARRRGPSRTRWADRRRQVRVHVPLAGAHHARAGGHGHRRSL